MDIIASGFDVATPSRRQPAGHSHDHRGDKGNPRSRRVNRSSRADAYAAFADEVLRDLNPRGPLESVMADHVASSAWKLKRAIDRRSDRPKPGSTSEGALPPVSARCAARSVREAIESFDAVRESRVKSEAVAASELVLEPLECLVEPNEWPIVPFEAADESLVEEAEGLEDETPIWRDRLVYDFEVSDVSPVIKGTWITVGHVVSLIVDGDSWSDVLRSHPELTEDDIRACVAYAVAQDQDEG